MAWRNHETHAAETKAVRAALSEAGISAAVGHGSGTAWGWLEIHLGAEGREWHEVDRGGPMWQACPPECGECLRGRALGAAAMRIVRAVTGRHGDHGGEVLILGQDRGGRAPIRQSGEWAPEAWASAGSLLRRA